MLETRLTLFTALLLDPLSGCFSIDRADSNANKRNDSAALKSSPKKGGSYCLDESPYPANEAAWNDELRNFARFCRTHTTSEQSRGERGEKGTERNGKDRETHHAKTHHLYMHLYVFLLNPSGYKSVKYTSIWWNFKIALDFTELSIIPPYSRTNREAFQAEFSFPPARRSSKLRREVLLNFESKLIC